MNRLSADFIFPCLWLRLSNLHPASITLLPPCLFGNQKIPSLSSAGLYAALYFFIFFLRKLFGARCKWLTPLLVLIKQRASSLLLSCSLDLWGLGQALVVFALSCLSQTCMIHCHLSKKGGRGGSWEKKRHFRARGVGLFFIPTALWIAWHTQFLFFFPTNS